VARRRTSIRAQEAAAFAVLMVVLLVVVAAEEHPLVFSLGAAVVVGVALWMWFRRRARRARAAAEGAALQDEAERYWREWVLPAGSYSVALTGYEDPLNLLPGFLAVLNENASIDVGDPEQLLRRARHIGPQIIVDEVDEDVAVPLKIALEGRGAKVKITERVAPTKKDNRRESIPERVRNEVWRRDGGQCVDCGSRERLEYDHIIPVSKCGSNTARNLELRCESCNRKKGAKV
jgi:HNH endonuclease